MEELEAIVAILVNLDTSVKEGLSLDKMRDKWSGRFKEVIQKEDDEQELLLHRFMEIREEVKVAKREIIKLKEVHGLVLVELKIIKFEDDWLDGLDSNVLQ